LVSLSSAGTLAVTFLGIFQFFIFGLIYAKYRSDKWNAWAAFISFSTVLYSGSVFIQYQTPPLDVNIICEKVQYMAILMIVYSAHGYTYSFLSLPPGQVLKVNGLLIALITGMIWLSNLIISDQVAYRNFLLMDRPYVEPELTLLGTLLLAYIVIFASNLFFIWSKQRKKAVPVLIGILIWIGLGINDVFATAGFPTIQFLMEYGFLAFMLAISVQNFTSYLKSEYQYKMIANHVSDTIWKMSLKPMQFTYVSPSVQKMRGYTVEEAMALSPAETISPESLTLVKRVLSAKLMEEARDPSEKDRAVVIEIQQRTKSDGFQWAELTVKFVYDEANAPVEILGVTRDITDRKRVEEEKRILEDRLNRAEKMEALGTLAGGVAHDLNNVLGIVVGYAEMLMYEIDESNPLRADLMKILEGGHRSAAIVQDLLTLARRGVQTSRIINLNTAILNCKKTPEFEKVLSLNPKVRMKIDLETDILNIIGSPVHLDKTIVNLVSNAVEAMPDGGTLSITTTNQYLDRPIQGYDAIREGDYVVLTVSDTGEGISEKDVKHIFEPFYTKKIMGKSGTGLGLAVVWGTVKDHNGYIDVHSQEGKGTSFAIYFPVTREEADHDHISVPASEYMGQCETVLVVDDVEGQRELATRMLTKLNYQVTAMASGEETVEYLKTNKADLIVLDMIMESGIDGLETYRKILEIHPTQKAIIVSGFSESERVQQAQKLGAGPYIKKPYVMEKIGMAIRDELLKVTTSAAHG
jgi:PAS domain S-box-containing protein